jgi:hypothetical protein
MARFEYNPNCEKLVVRLRPNYEKKFKKRYGKRFKDTYTTDYFEWEEGMDKWIARNLIIEGPLLEVVQYLWDKPTLWLDWPRMLTPGICYINFRGFHFYPELIDDIAAVHRKLGPVLCFHGPPYSIPILSFSEPQNKQFKAQK